MQIPSVPNPNVYRPKEVIGLIQGMTPGSINEWFVAQALDKLNIYYFYQFTIDAGRSIRGGQVIDFLVFSAGWVPVYVNGDYWHDIRHDPEMILNLAAARARFGREPVVLGEDETSTREKALNAVKREVLL